MEPIAIHDFYFVGLPPLPASGTLTLPALVVDGVTVVLPPMQFTRRLYAAVVPMNC